jgi:hypothetical protein
MSNTYDTAASFVACYISLPKKYIILYRFRPELKKMVPVHP